MADRTNGGPAFPQVETDPALDRESGQHYSHVYSYGGMSLRDHFAGQALSGVFATGDSDWCEDRTLARRCYELADALLAAREGK